jgi:hypothetical protein
MPFELCNAPATFQREINWSLPHLLGLELVNKTDIDIGEGDRMVLVAYIDDILIATTGSLPKHHSQGSIVFQLVMDNPMWIEIDKCVFETMETTFLGFVVNQSGLCMDHEKAKAIIECPRPPSKKDVQQLLGLWNFYRRFSQDCSGIVSPITN